MNQPLFYAKWNSYTKSNVIKDKEYLCLGVYQMDVGGLIKFLLVGEDGLFVFARQTDILFTRIHSPEQQDIPISPPVELTTEQLVMDIKKGKK